MHLLSTLFVATAVTAIHSRGVAGHCQDPSLRREWRSLSTEERTSYVDAVKCLKTKPSRIGLSSTLYDDFPYVHNVLDSDIHFVASFLPWHRYFLRVYEQALQQCGYTGAAVYWDWSLDADDPSSSPIWDPVTGFGGNGNISKQEYAGGSTYRCVTDGPFQSLRPTYVTSHYRPHCLSRNFNNGTEHIGQMLGEHYTPEILADIAAIQNYNDFRIELESGPHGAVHSAIAGDMMPSTSPNDPLFFLHHAQIDRLWALWQEADSDKRSADFGGDRTQQDNTTQASLTDLLPMLGMAEDLPVADLMSTSSDLLCYRY